MHSFTKRNYRVYSAYTYKAGQSLATSHTFDMVILDINLPDGDGFQFCKWIKARSNISVLFLFARDLEEDVLTGYEIGADDYVTKPFSMKILLKKIPIILSREIKKSNIYDDGFLKIDFELGVVQIEENSCSITPTEYRILKKND